ncbi:hypothetical protein DYB34_011185, partial [Aphanomyces astaci]
MPSSPKTNAYVVVKVYGRLFCHWVPLGFAYVAFSLGCNVGYMALLTEYTTNDYWWRQFNTSGGQTFVADIFNAKINLGQSGPFDLYQSPILKNYGDTTTFIDMPPTAARRHLMSAVPLEKAVMTIRQNSLYENVYSIVAHCWVDFDRRFEMAHTSARQRRCAARQLTNAGVYMETMLRNVDSDDLTLSAYGIQINQTILAPLMVLPGGPEWVIALHRQTSNWLPEADEVALWRQHGLRHLSLQFQNRFHYGLDSSITIVNALMMTQTMKIASMPYIDRGLAAWSTRTISAGLWSDMTKAIGFGASLVRNSNTSVEALGRDWDIAYIGTSSTVGATLMRKYLGPLANWDTIFLMPPRSLVALVVSFQSRFHAAASDATFTAAMDSLQSVNVEVVPPHWGADSIVYYGGNPICAPVALARSFVQMPFSFDDTCQTQAPFQMALDSPGVVFATLLANASTPDTTVEACSSSTAASMASCVKVVTTAAALLSGLVMTFQADDIGSVGQEVQKLDILFIQMATINATKNVLLTQQIIGDDRAWDLFGWVALYDWVHGTREVLTFEGDAGSLTLMSTRSDNIPVAANALELPKTACLYFWTAALWVSVLAAVVSTLLVVYATANKFQIEGRNLFHFNRVFGSVWIGRPLLFVRGITAIIILSTAPATISTTPHRVTSFTPYQREWTSQLLLYSESLWVVYVLNDILLPFTIELQIASDVAPVSSFLAFTAVVSLDVASPYQVQANVAQDCTFTSFRRGVACTGGEVRLGSGERVAHLLGLQFASLVVALVATVTYARCYPSRHPPRTTAPNNVLIPAATEAFFVRSSGRFASSRHLDAVTCVMSGMLPWKQTLFDFKIWATVMRHNKTNTRRMSFRDATFQHHVSGPTLPPMFGRKHAWLGFVGLLYMVTSISGSYAFFQLTQSAMSNDFWWASFDTNTQVHLSNWFNQNLQLHQFASNVDLTALEQGTLALTTNASATALQIAPLYAISVQDEANSLGNVVQSLRQMDSCAIPWIMTAYCYVDFSRRWDMANTAAKQRRCATDQSNAAVYLESVLRNTDWSQLSSCWGEALDIGVFTYLQTTTDGLAWLSRTSHAMETTSVLDEVGHWSNANLSSYSTQWQNYKSLGVVETFSIRNAFGWKYPLTLKYSNGSLQLSVQTSLKMQRPFAHDLMAVLSNATSRIHGKSLVRDSPLFAYLNVTAEQSLVDGGLLVPPLGNGFSLIQRYLGPFGSVTMKRVACPLALRGLYKNITLALMELFASRQDAQHAMWPIYTSYTIAPRPKMWNSVALGGGNVLCEFNPSAATSKIPGLAFSSGGSCGLNLQEFIIGDTKTIMTALVAVKNVSVSAVARLEFRNPTSTLAALEASVAFLHTYFDPALATTFYTQAQIVKAVVRDQLHVQMIQFIRPNQTFSLSQMTLFGETEVDFEVYAWLYAFDWVQGVREVVSFQGDNGTLTLLSMATNLLDAPVNPMEVPSNVAYYLRYLVQYITLVMFCVASVVCVYIIALKGQVEAANMMVFSRIAGLVWIGRWLIFLRALSAVCLLA